jgi:hypothetical protein
MKRFGKMTPLALGFGILAVALASVSTLPAAASESAPATPNNPPLHTRDVDNPAHGAFGRSDNCVVLAAATSCSGLGTTVPPGTELVIETISILADGPSQEQLFVNFDVTTGGSSNCCVISLPVPFAGAFQVVGGLVYEWVLTQPVRLYADGGTTVSFNGFQSGVAGSQGGTFFSVSFSGYLVSCGSGTGCPVP